MVRPSLTQFVEELANEQDYWMSLTDAARVTRTSEPMVRRWVAAGRLPVRKEPVGINQRTRLVRASDVSRLRPIVDPTAAITDEIHKLDLLSIPRQQTHILQEHQRLLAQIQEVRQAEEEHLRHIQSLFQEQVRGLQQQMQEWSQRFSSHQEKWQQALNVQRENLDALADQVVHKTQEIEKLLSELNQQGKRYQHHLGQLDGRLRSQQEILQTLPGQLERLKQDFQGQLDQVSHDFMTRLNQQEEGFKNTLTDLVKRLDQYDEAQKEIQHDVRSVEQRFLIYQEILKAQMEEWRYGLQRALESGIASRKTEQEESFKAIEQRMQSLFSQLQATQNALLTYQERDHTQEQQHQTLMTMLQEERAMCQSLAAQATTQHEQIQTLHRELEKLKAKKIRKNEKD
jgi:chromosome segregation ATPase